MYKPSLMHNTLRLPHWFTFALPGLQLSIVHDVMGSTLKVAREALDGNLWQYP